MTTRELTSIENQRTIALWLFAVSFMVFAMIVLGGLTRLTHSGLSMVEWRPITGWLPPFSEIEWQRVFGKYQEFPEFREVNADMTLVEFKGIFWLEFLHRLWGRLIGVVFFVPFAYFLIKGWLRGRQALGIGAIFVLGGLQGGMGWFMVKSGLVDQPDVSQYRLAAHLILALVIYACLIWCGLRFWSGHIEKSAAPVPLYRYSQWLVLLIFVTAFSGALVAGLDAGLSYNTFPLMDGDLIPAGLFVNQPFYLNFFENRMTVQFDHRVLALLTFIVILHFWIMARKGDLGAYRMRPVHWLVGMVFVQVGLGISTLLLAVPVSLGALHQAGAIILLGVAVWVAYQMFGVKTGS